MYRCDHNECCGHSNDRVGAEIGMLHNLLRRQMARQKSQDIRLSFSNTETPREPENSRRVSVQ